MSASVADTHPHIDFAKHWSISHDTMYQMGQCDAIIRSIRSMPLEPGLHQYLLNLSLTSGAQATTAIEGIPSRMTKFSRSDVSDAKEMEAFADHVRNTFNTKHINLLFNNAGIAGGGSFLKETREQWEKTFSVCWATPRSRTQYSNRLADTTTAHIGRIDEKARVSIDRSEMTMIDVSRNDSVTTLRFDFGGSEVHRSEKVQIFECDDRCVFLSNATVPGYVDSLTSGDIIKLTWARNRQIDLVEFVIDPAHRVVGRVVHPLENMTYQEFLYCAYTLAVEADGLEYLLHKSDIH